MNETVYLDLETTGLDAISDEIVEIAIIDDQGNELMNTLVKPIRHEAWPQAEAIHGITPAMVENAPLFIDLRESIQSFMEGKRVVIYNASFDTGFLGSLLNNAKAIECCMQAFSNYMDEPHYYGGVKWQSLATATHHIGYDWIGDAHRALADCKACRAVWHYLSEESQQQREMDRKARTTENSAKMALRFLEHDAKIRQTRLERYVTDFLKKWWLKQYEPHWITQFRNEYTGNATADQFAQIFYGKKLALLDLEDQFDEIYTSKKDIPEHLKPMSYFNNQEWFRAHLIPVAAYVGKKQGWPLYPASEKKRIVELYPLRFASADNTLTRTDLKKRGFTDKEINAMKPVAERQNQHNFKWYPLYLIPS